MKGTVFKSTGSWYHIYAEDNKYYNGRLRGKFKIQDLKVTNPIAVGDLVNFEIEKGAEETAWITKIIPRRNYFIRTSVHKSAHGHLIASNIDQAVMVVTLKNPRTSTGFIDRFLVSAESFQIPAILVFNKLDLYSQQDRETLADLEAIYNKLNYKCLAVSAKENIGMEILIGELNNKTSLISGHSGVGKSSLINILIPNLDIKTAEISEYANKGVHTTTFAEMHFLNSHAKIIDTPGIKEFGLFEISREELGHYFPEIRLLMQECKFHNCNHINEPKCAVIQAVTQGYIASSRYNNYVSMLFNEETHR